MASPVIRSTMWRSVRRPLKSAPSSRWHLHLNTTESISTTPVPNSTSALASMRTLPTCREHFLTFLGSPFVFSFFDKQTFTWQYLVTDPDTAESVVIDPVLDYNNVTNTASTHTSDCMLDFVNQKGLKISRILETHAHADHLTASQYYKAKLSDNVPVCIGKRIKQVQKTFASRYGLDPSSLNDAFDILLEDDEEFKLGELSCRVIHIPGHTPDHVGYVIGRSVFTGDSLFLPDVGSARADFPGGNMKELYASMQRLLALPQDYRLFVGHDYPPGNRHPACMATVEEQRHSNTHVKIGIDESSFIKLREARDATLDQPKLLHPSLRVNIRAGKPSPPAQNGQTLGWAPLPFLSL